MIRAEWLYWIVGLFFVGVGVLTWLDHAHPKRLGSGAFWTVLGLTFPYGTFVVNGSAPAAVLGAAVIGIAVLAGFGFPGRPTLGLPPDTVLVERAKRFGWRLFLPALAIPVVAVVFGSALPNVHLGDQLLIEKGSATLVGLVAGSVVALVVAMAMLRVSSPVEPLHEGRRLLGQIGWAAVLPQMLATLGVLFTAAGVGKAVGRVAGDIVPTSSLVASVGVYCLGMALFTIVMGNAFAAFPIMTAAIGWPILVQQFGGNPVVIFAVGMLAGFCGTLCTPMAANFNLVPSALLEMKDRYGVIKAQVPTAVPLLVANVAIIYLFAF